MEKIKVCLVTGAGGRLGQHIVAKLVENNQKVIALAEADETFSPDILKTHHIKINTALPVTKASFSKHDVQFCFGDLSDISFIASIFASVDKTNIEVEYVFHLTANSLIQKATPLAYHPDFGDIVNVLEEGSDKLVLADMNEESANMLALQTRQQLAINSLSLASQASQSVLKLFG